MDRARQQDVHLLRCVAVVRFVLARTQFSVRHFKHTCTMMCSLSYASTRHHVRISNAAHLYDDTTELLSQLWQVP